MRYELRRIEIWPVAKIVFILSLLLGFFIGLLYAGVLLFAGALAPADEMFLDSGDMSLVSVAVLVFFICVVFIPIVYTLFSVIFAALYNLVASWVGGFRVEFERIDIPQPTDEPKG